MLILFFLKIESHVELLHLKDAHRLVFVQVATFSQCWTVIEFIYSTIRLCVSIFILLLQDISESKEQVQQSVTESKKLMNVI